MISIMYYEVIIETCDVNIVKWTINVVCCLDVMEFKTYLI